MPALDYERWADLYDTLVAGGDDVSFFVEQASNTPGKVVELMAGTGRVSVPVAAAGADLTCVDSSPAMLERLRRKLASRSLSAEIVEQDVTRLDLDARFTLAFIAFHSFEELVDDDARECALRGIFDALAPGGCFVCTLHDPGVRLGQVGPGRDIRRRFHDPGSGNDIEMCLSSASEGVAVVGGVQRFRDLATGETLLELPIRFRLSTGEEFRALVERFGFGVEGVYGGYDACPYIAGSSPSMIWMLRRPEAA